MNQPHTRHQITLILSSGLRAIVVPLADSRTGTMLLSKEHGTRTTPHLAARMRKHSPDDGDVVSQFRDMGHWKPWYQSKPSMLSLVHKQAKTLSIRTAIVLQGWIVVFVIGRTCLWIFGPIFHFNIITWRPRVEARTRVVVNMCLDFPFASHQILSERYEEKALNKQI